MGRLTGKVAIVTGGAGGIGEAIVARFASEGAEVMVADLREPPSMLKNAAYVRTDVTQQAADVAGGCLGGNFTALGSARHPRQ